MARVYVDANIVAHAAALVMLVPVDSNLTAWEFDCLCRRLEAADGAMSMHCSGDGGRVLKSRPLEQVTLAREADSYSTVDLSCHESAFEHFSWRKGLIWYQTIRHDEVDRNGIISWSSVEAYRRVRGAIGIRASGLSTVDDQRLTLKAAVESGSDPTLCAVRVYSPDVRSATSVVDTLLMDICLALHSEARALNVKPPDLFSLISRFRREVVQGRCIVVPSCIL